MSGGWTNREARRLVCLLLLGVAALLGLPGGGSGAASAAEAFYLLMFGAQRTPNDPDFSHTWATFVRATWPDHCETASSPSLAPQVEAHTISWLPLNMIVRTRALCPECGWNFDLHTTLRWCQGNRMRVSLWGAYQIQPELYGRALGQIALLQSGRVRYKAVDAGYRSDEVSNCIHALSSLSQGARLRVLSPGWGEPASHFVLQELRPWVVSACRHAWVGSALGLDCHPIIYRDWGPPFSGTFFGPVYRLFGGENDLGPTYGPPPPRVRRR